MKIRYDNSIEDIVALDRFHFGHSPTFRMQRIAIGIFAWGLPAVLAILFLLAWASDICETGAVTSSDVISLVVFLAIGAPVAVLWVWKMPGLAIWSIDRQVRRMYRGGANKGLLGTHELELTPTNLIEWSEYNESVSKLEVVERVVDVGDLAFIYLSAVTAYVIPRRAVSEGDYDKFVDALAERVDTAAHSYRVE